MRLKYVAQIRSAELVSTALIPFLFEVLGVSDRTRPFDLSLWTVESPHFKREFPLLVVCESC